MAASPPSLAVLAGSAGASLSGNETAGSIIRSDGKSLCKVFCIITYQSQNSHPQILWVTKHQQLPHYCPPKSSPTNDKERGEREEEEEEERERARLLNLSLGDWIFIPIIKVKKIIPELTTCLHIVVKFRGLAKAAGSCSSGSTSWGGSTKVLHILCISSVRKIRLFKGN